MDLITAGAGVVGLVLLLVGADLLVRGASSIARKASISPLIIGLTVVAIGTSAPEVAISVQASLSGNSDIAVGNVVGSNIFNILLILGLSAIIVPLFVQAQLVRFDVPVLIVVSFVVFGMSYDGAISRIESLFLLAGVVGYLGFLILSSRRSRELLDPAAVDDDEANDLPPERSIPLSLAIAGAGLGMLVIGARWLVDAATDGARALGVSELIISLTVVAAGTSLPEVATSIAAALRGERDIAVGNAIGSSIMNFLLVLGVAGMVSMNGLQVADSVIAFDMPVEIAVAVACLPIFFTGRLIARWEGGLFLFYYFAYTGYLILDATDHDALSGYSTAMAWFVIPLTVLTVGTLSLRAVRQELQDRASGAPS